MFRSYTQLHLWWVAYLLYQMWFLGEYIFRYAATPTSHLRFAVQSHSNNDIVLEHNLNDFPKRVSIQFSPTNPPKEEVYDMSAMGWYAANHPHNSAIHSGSIKLTKNTLTLGIWSGGFVGRFWAVQGDWQSWKAGFYRIVAEV